MNRHTIVLPYEWWANLWVQIRPSLLTADPKSHARLRFDQGPRSRDPGGEARRPWPPAPPPGQAARRQGLRPPALPRVPASARHHRPHRPPWVESKDRLGRVRWVVERTVSWLVRYKRLGLRYDRSELTMTALPTLACAHTCYKILKPCLSTFTARSHMSSGTGRLFAVRSSTRYSDASNASSGPAPPPRRSR